jgi:hypothetical protein
LAPVTAASCARDFAGLLLPLVEWAISTADEIVGQA